MRRQWPHLGLLCLVARVSVSQAGRTSTGDKRALLELKAGWTNGADIFPGWNETSDPCGCDGPDPNGLGGQPWSGIVCDCQDFNGDPYLAWPNLQPCECGAVDEARVTYLDLGITRPDRQPIAGVISPAIGDLTALRAVNFNNNGEGLGGELPSTMARLDNVTTLMLANNSFSGSLPSWLPDMDNVTSVFLQSNRFSGPIPDDWCQLATGDLQTRLDLSFNKELCGVVDECLKFVLFSFDSTQLFFMNEVVDDNFAQPFTNSTYLTDYCCGTGQPSCYMSEGCGVIVPQYWPSVGPAINVTNTVISFNFTSFEGGETNIDGTLESIQNTLVPLYSWRLSLSMEECSNRWFQFDPAHVTVFEDVDSNLGPGPVHSNRTVLQYATSPSEQPGLMVDDGRRYYVVVRAQSLYCKNAVFYVSSQSDATVVASGPQPNGMVLIEGDNKLITEVFAFSDRQFECINGTQCHYSWSLFERQPESPVSSSRRIEGPKTLNVTGKWPLETVFDDISRLTKGLIYHVEIDVTSPANVSGQGMSNEVLWNANGNSGYSIGPMVATSIAVGCLLILAAVIVISLFAWRRDRAQKRHWKRCQHMDQLREMMHQSIHSVMGMNNGWQPPSTMGPVTGTAVLAKATSMHQPPYATVGKVDMFGLRELALVITDLQDSTPMAAADAQAYSEVLELHNNLIRDLIECMGGYEIITEGDSFHIAFPNVAAAVQFSCGVQYQLLQAVWPHRVLKLPSCKKVYSDGELIFSGPRVRIGIHWAEEGTVGGRQHQLTKHWVFSGPGVNLASELGDIGHGGQILLSKAAWHELRTQMPAAGFPTVRQLGLYKLAAWASPVWVYELQQQMGRPLFRSFPALRKAKFLQPGYGFQIVPPPREEKGLVFVAMAVDRSHITWPLQSLPWLPCRCFTLVAVMAQQFQGYLYYVDNDTLEYRATFPSVLDAVRFCHCAQVAMMYEQWPRDSRAHVLGATVKALDNKDIFRGVRIAMSVVSTRRFSAVRVPKPSPDEDVSRAPWEDCYYSGYGPKLAAALARCGHGGQVVVNEQAWKRVQDRLPGRCQIISLGEHLVAGGFPEPLLLMEVMPLILARRLFPPLKTEACISPGYRDSPDPADVAIVFVNVAKPREVVAAQRMEESLDDGHLLTVMTTYLQGIHAFEELLRRLLVSHDGYECKEPEQGKFTLAFRSLEAAVRCCCALQVELMEVDWPSLLTTWDGCGEVLDADGRRVWRGLRVRAGIAYGAADHRKPLNTGRADYYGSLPNLAARVCSLAQPGQVLTECNGVSCFTAAPTPGSTSWGSSTNKSVNANSPFGHVGQLLFPVRFLGPWPPRAAHTLLLQPLGRFKLKGFDDERTVYDCHDALLGARAAGGYAVGAESSVSASRPSSTSFSMTRSETMPMMQQRTTTASAQSGTNGGGGGALERMWQRQGGGSGQQQHQEQGADTGSEDTVRGLVGGVGSALGSFSRMVAYDSFGGHGANQALSCPSAVPEQQTAGNFDSGSSIGVFSPQQQQLQQRGSGSGSARGGASWGAWLLRVIKSSISFSDVGHAGDSQPGANLWRTDTDLMQVVGLPRKKTAPTSATDAVQRSTSSATATTRVLTLKGLTLNPKTSSATAAHGSGAGPPEASPSTLASLDLQGLGSAKRLGSVTSSCVGGRRASGSTGPSAAVLQHPTAISVGGGRSQSVSLGEVAAAAERMRMMAPALAANQGSRQGMATHAEDLLIWNTLPWAEPELRRCVSLPARLDGCELDGGNDDCDNCGDWYGLPMQGQATATTAAAACAIAAAAPQPLLPVREEEANGGGSLGSGSRTAPVPHQSRAPWQALRQHIHKQQRRNGGRPAGLETSNRRHRVAALAQRMATLPTSLVRSRPRGEGAEGGGWERQAGGDVTAAQPPAAVRGADVAAGDDVTNRAARPPAAARGDAVVEASGVDTAAVVATVAADSSGSTPPMPRGPLPQPPEPFGATAGAGGWTSGAAGGGRGDEDGRIPLAQGGGGPAASPFSVANHAPNPDNAAGVTHPAASDGLASTATHITSSTDTNGSRAAGQPQMPPSSSGGHPSASRAPAAGGGRGGIGKGGGGGEGQSDVVPSVSVALPSPLLRRPSPRTFQAHSLASTFVRSRRKSARLQGPLPPDPSGRAVPRSAAEAVASSPGHIGGGMGPLQEGEELSGSAQPSSRGGSESSGSGRRQQQQQQVEEESEHSPRHRRRRQQQRQQEYRVGTEEARGERLHDEYTCWAPDDVYTTSNGVYTTSSQDELLRATGNDTAPRGGGRGAWAGDGRSSDDGDSEDDESEEMDQQQMLSHHPKLLAAMSTDMSTSSDEWKPKEHTLGTAVKRRMLSLPRPQLGVRIAKHMPRSAQAISSLSVPASLYCTAPPSALTSARPSFKRSHHHLLPSAQDLPVSSPPPPAQDVPARQQLKGGTVTPRGVLK